MASWTELHRASATAAIAAELAAKAGRPAESASLYSSAAMLEEQAFGVVARSKTRTRSITGISAAALWFKASEYGKAAAVAGVLLGDPSTPEHARSELAKLMDAMPPGSLRATA